MDSPDRDLTISAAEVQGSPLFNFLCSLSPIKPVKSMHVAQAFSDLTFPPPPAVFVSPKADARKDSRSSQRNQSTSKAERGQTGAGSCQGTGHSESRELLPTVTERLHNLEGAGKDKNAQERDQPSTSSSSSLANYVEQYLDELVECDVDAVGSSSESLALNACRSKPPILDSNSENGVSIAGAGACELNKCEKASSSVISSDVLESHGSDVAEQQIVDVNVMQNTLEPDVSSAGCHESSDYSFLLPSGVDKLPAHGCVDDWQSQLSSLSDLSVQEMAKYLATLKEIISEAAPDAGTDALCSQVSNVCTAEFKADTHGMTDQEIDNAVKNDKQEGTAFRANTLPLRGVRRRCLDFELQEGPEKSKTSMLSLKSCHANENIRSHISPLCSKKIPESLLRERASATSGATNSEPNLGMDVCIQPCTSIDGKPTTKVVLTGSSMLKLSSCLSRKDSQCKATKSENQLVCARRASGTSPVGMPSGIGLHLNSLTGGTPILQSLRETEGTSSKSIIPATSTLQQDLEENCKNHLPVPSSDNNSPYQTGTKSRKELLVSLVEKTSVGECEVHWEGPDRLVSATKSMTCFRTVTLGIKQADKIVPSCRVEKKPSPLGRKRVLLPDLPHQLDPDGVEDSSQSPPSPKKKRKSNSAVEKGGDGCKRCNCKKSKCLKLYCDCFAAGVYCVDSCTCQGCLNKPEFEETVLGTRQQIESRNPLAFAPKIVRGADSSPTNGDDCGETPASARHKRGCNCKRSQCLKKYCECYQAGVGCSDGCRCEGCKNLYGRKEVLEESEDRGSQVERVDEQVVVDEMDMRDFGTEEQRDALTPVTPFQNLGPSRSTMKSRTATKRRFSSEELLSSGKPSGSPSRLLRSSKGMQSSNPLVSLPTQLPKAVVSPLSTPKMLKIGEFSPRWDGLGNICTLTPLPQAPLRPTPASVSAFDGTECSPPSFSQHKCDQARSSNSSARHSSKFSQRLSLQASVCLNNHQGQTSVNVQSTPSTPGFTSYSDSNPHFEDSGDISHEFVGSTEDDNTPEFLKDPVSGSSPIQLLKTSSPKQKRVSPPHYQTAREPSGRGLPSPGLRSGRKIILQAVPSVPCTPFSDGHEQMTQR